LTISKNNTNAGQTDYTYDLLNRTTSITQSGTGVQKVNQVTGLSRFSDLGGVNLVAETSYLDSAKFFCREKTTFLCPEGRNAGKWLKHKKDQPA
jgi:hypothetical protein